MLTEVEQEAITVAAMELKGLSPEADRYVDILLNLLERLKNPDLK